MIAIARLAPARHNDREVTFRWNLGYPLQMLRNPSGAIEQYGKATELEPKLGSAWSNLGTAGRDR